MTEFHIRTPALIESVEIARDVLAGIRSGEIDPRSALLQLLVSRVIQAAVGGDLKVRVAAPRILAQEAKLVEERSKTTPHHVEDKRESA
jgi:hypothetical protein